MRRPGVINTTVRDRGLLWKSVFGAGAVAVCAAVGVWVELRVDASRRDALETSLQADGYGAPRLEREWGPRCGLAAGAYRWIAGGASGSACVGPVSRVSVEVDGRARDDRPTR